MFSASLITGKSQHNMRNNANEFNKTITSQHLHNMSHFLSGMQMENVGSPQKQDTIDALNSVANAGALASLLSQNGLVD